MAKLAELFSDAPRSTGHDRWWSERLASGGTVSMLREHGSASSLYLAAVRGYAGDATTPIEVCPAGELLLPILAHVVLDASEAETAATTEWTWIGGNVRVLTEMVAVHPVSEDFDAHEEHAGGDDDDESDGEALDRLAREIMAVDPARDIERPAVPELSADQVENARLLFNLTFAQLADLLGVTERQMYRYAGGEIPVDRRETLDALVATGLLLAGSLNADGRRAWLDSGAPSSVQLLREGQASDVRSRAEDLRDSIAS
jgi:hypothetical protein